MTHFIIDLKTARPDRVFVEVDRRFDVAIIRTGAGLQFQIYPRTNGELWFEPFASFDVQETEVIALEQQMEE